MGSHNYCRNPSTSKKDDGPWCYVADTSKTWEYCKIPECGHYLYLESSYPMQPGDHVTITTPQFLTSGPGCKFQFWYHMNGDSIGHLYVTVNSTRGNWSTEIVNPYISDWHKASIPLGAIADFTVSLIGVRGASYTGDIAIDDTQFVDCAPSGYPTPPRLLNVTDDLTLTPDDHDFRLDCLMSGNLAPDITWYHNGKLRQCLNLISKIVSYL